MELKVDKSPGPDGMYPRVLKEMVGEIANALVEKQFRDDYLNGKNLQHIAVQRDLVILLHELQKVGLQVQQVIKKANEILFFIARRIEFKRREVMLQLYRVL
eukprot:g33822.t1